MALSAAWGNVVQELKKEGDGALSDRVGPISQFVERAAESQADKDYAADAMRIAEEIWNLAVANKRSQPDDGGDLTNISAECEVRRAAITLFGAALPDDGTSGHEKIAAWTIDCSTRLIRGAKDCEAASDLLCRGAKYFGEGTSDSNVYFTSRLLFAELHFNNKQVRSRQICVPSHTSRSHLTAS